MLALPEIQISSPIFRICFWIVEPTPKPLRFNTKRRKDALDIVVRIIDMEPTAESNGYESQSSDTRTTTDNSANHKNISAFEESVNSNNEEPIRSPSGEVRTDEESLPSLE